MSRRILALVIGALVALSVPVAAVAAGEASGRVDKLSKIDHIVVIYEENHSFDNLYGGWEGVNGLANADTAHMTQVDQAGLAYECLKQDDVNLTAPSPLSVACTDSRGFSSHFTNAPFTIDSFIAPTDTTCPAPGVFAPNGVLNGSGDPGGCTRDLVHRYYQEQYQIDGGAQDRYATGSDAIGLSMGHYDTTALPIYQYLHQDGHPKYAIADAFFQGAFGGSFLNHQWLVAAATPIWPGAVNDGSSIDLHSELDASGMPTSSPLYTTTVNGDRALTQSCAPAATRAALQPAYVCGDYAVNTIQPTYQPYSPGTPLAKRLPPQTATTIGDELSGAGISWAWYSGGWSNADGDVNGPGWTNGSTPVTRGTNTQGCPDPASLATAIWPNCPDKLFQFHHQAFNYFAAFDPGTVAGAANRAGHLRDETEFLSAAAASAKTCQLKSVSFVKPIGAENEHPGYASEPNGSDHLVDLLSAIEGSACARDTMVIVTYDEFGGQWDHVPPPGFGTAGPHDQWGPGTRIPALIVSPYLSADFVVDSTSHDTTSILATIEHRFGLSALGTRDAAVADLSSVFTAKSPFDN